MPHLLKVINGVGGGAGEPRGETVTSSSGDETASWQIWTQKDAISPESREEWRQNISDEESIMGKSSRWHSFHGRQRRAGRKKARFKRCERIEKGQSKKQPGWISKVWCIHTVEYHSAEKASRPSSHQGTRRPQSTHCWAKEAGYLQRPPAIMMPTICHPESTTTQAKPSVAARRRGEQAGWRGGERGIFRAGKPLCTIAQGWPHDIILSPKALEPQHRSWSPV